MAISAPFAFRGFSDQHVVYSIIYIYILVKHSWHKRYHIGSSNPLLVSESAQKGGKRHFLWQASLKTDPISVPWELKEWPFISQGTLIPPVAGYHTTYTGKLCKLPPLITSRRMLFIFSTLEAVSRCRDPQLQVRENTISNNKRFKVPTFSMLEVHTVTLGDAIYKNIYL